MATPAERTPLEARIRAVMDAVENYELAESAAWSDLDALSTHTYIDGIEIDPEGVILEDNRFHGVMNVYVLLTYGSDKEDGFETSDAFLGQFEGHFNPEGKAVIDNLTVDTSPFYEGEARNLT